MVPAERIELPTFGLQNRHEDVDLKGLLLIIGSRTAACATSSSMYADP
jgi:hypothetical protein